MSVEEWPCICSGSATNRISQHFIADRQGGSVVLAWDVRNTPALSWRVLRSDKDFAETADALVGTGQTLVSESAQCGARDATIDDETTYYYTVFASDEQGVWHRQVKAKIKAAERLQWRHPAHWETVRERLRELRRGAARVGSGRAEDPE